ncbi:MAG: zinc-dependent alcohol dehydrogenase [Promethearchaeota archaeon]|jgi:threonine dehydrogenase-like Zn-dependent dehydrogenase
MKAAVFDGNEITIKSVNDPKISETQVLIKVKAAGICGTDLAIVNKSLPTPIPLILGHEFAGEVVKIGEEVNGKWLDKRVTSEINTNVDFKCSFCKQGKYSQCISRKALGIDVNGAFAEYIAVESYLLHEIPDSISYDEATFIEPLAAAYQVFERMPVDQNDKTMAIFGLGKLGLLITQVSMLKGLTLFVVDDSPKKLDLAKKFGAHYPINRFEGPNVANKIRDFTIGLGADIVVDTTGNPLALNDVINSCKTQGKVHLKSTHGIDTPVNLTDIVIRELTLYSSRCGPFPKAIDGLQSRDIKVDKLISKKYDLKDIEKAFSAHKKSKDLVKTIISMK